MTPGFHFEPVTETETDFDALLALPIGVMRENLERIGRFDSQCAAERFHSTFRPAATRRVGVGRERAGCVAFWAEGEAMRVEHFYLAPSHQRLGLGSAVLRRRFDETAPSVACFRVDALKGSDANRFCERHGFVEVSEGEWDIAYERPRNSPVRKSPAQENFR